MSCARRGGGVTSESVSHRYLLVGCDGHRIAARPSREAISVLWEFRLLISGARKLPNDVAPPLLLLLLRLGPERGWLSAVHKFKLSLTCTLLRD